jgi:hypothetical protein
MSKNALGRLFGVATGIALVLAACRDQFTEPGRVIHPSGAPRRTQTLGTAPIPVPPNNTAGGGTVPTFSTGISVPVNGRFVVTVSGNITVGDNPNPCNATGSLQGTYGPNGFNDGAAELLVGVSLIHSMGQAGISFTPGYGGLNGPTTIRSDTIRAVYGGVIWAGRGGIAGATNCGSPTDTYGLYSLSGSQTVSVDLIDMFVPHLTLTASKLRGGVGDTITYTAGNNDPVYSSFTITQWRWVADSGFTPPAGTVEKLSVGQCGTSSVCRHTPLVPGTMWVIGTANGQPDSASVHVAIVPCPLGDSVMDDPHVRQLLNLYQQQSESAHVEYGGYIYFDKIAQAYVVNYQPLPPPNAPTECHFSLQIPPPFQDSIYIAVRSWHTHPTQPGRRFSNCPDRAPGSEAGRGPSRPWDFNTVNSTGIPGLITDPNDAWVVVPNSQRRWWQSTVTSKSRTSKQCSPWV